MKRVLDAYRENYDRIAADHIRHWRAHGTNPFQSTAAVEQNEGATAELIRRYAADGDRILDAGCGMGLLLSRFPNLDRYGFDLSSAYLEIAAEYGVKTTQGWIEKMPYAAGSFEIVVCTDVLEHVLDLNATVKELLRVLRKGGILIVRTPNEEGLVYNTDPYEFVHLRRFDQMTMRLLFGKIFSCEVIETPITGDIVHAVVRK